MITRQLHARQARPVRQAHPARPVLSTRCAQRTGNNCMERAQHPSCRLMRWLVLSAPQQRARHKPTDAYTLTYAEIQAR